MNSRLAVKLLLNCFFLLTCPIYSVPLYFCSGANSTYFPQLLNLIGSIHRINFETLQEIAVFDLGLNSNEIDHLKTIQKVTLHKLEQTNPDILTPFSRLGWFSWKPVAIKQALDRFPYVLWVDAGTVVLRPLDDLFAYIDHHGYFLSTIGDETINDVVQHPLRYGATKNVIDTFDLNSPEKNWILSQELIMGGLLGVSRSKKIYNNFVMPLYTFAHDIKNFEDDGTTPNGYGTAMHDQTLITIQTYLNSLLFHRQDFTQERAIYLTINSQPVPFYITWHTNYVCDKTHIFNCRKGAHRFRFEDSIRYITSQPKPRL